METLCCLIAGELFTMMEIITGQYTYGFMLSAHRSCCFRSELIARIRGLGSGIFRVLVIFLLATPLLYQRSKFFQLSRNFLRYFDESSVVFF